MFILLLQHIQSYNLLILRYISVLQCMRILAVFLQYLVYQLPEYSDTTLIHVGGLMNYMTAYLAREFVG